MRQLLRANVELWRGHEVDTRGMASSRSFTAPPMGKAAPAKRCMLSGRPGVLYVSGEGSVRRCTPIQVEKSLKEVQAPGERDESTPDEHATSYHEVVERAERLQVEK